MVRTRARNGAGLGRADLDVGHRPFEQASVHQRRQGQIGYRRVTAHAGDVLGAGDLVAIALGQAVDKSAQPLGCGVVLAVPLCISGRIAKAKVGRAVDDPLGHPRVAFDVSCRVALGPAEEQEFTGLERVGMRELQVRGAAQVGVWHVNEPAGLRRRRGLGDRNARMRQEATEQLAPDISAGAYNACLEGLQHGDLYC